MEKNIDLTERTLALYQVNTAISKCGEGPAGNNCRARLLNCRAQMRRRINPGAADGSHDMA